MNLRGKQIDISDFDATIMEDCKDEANLDYGYGEKDPDAKKPDMFSHRKWVAWEKTVYTYFTDIKNSRGLPLAYVIRNNLYP